MPGKRLQQESGLGLDFLPSPSKLAQEISEAAGLGNDGIQNLLDNLIPEALQADGMALDLLEPAGEAIQALVRGAVEEASDQGGDLLDGALGLGQEVLDGALETGEDLLDMGEDRLNDASALAEELLHEAEEWWSGFETPDNLSSPSAPTVDGQATHYGLPTLNEGANADEMEDLPDSNIVDFEEKVEVVATEAEPAEGLQVPESAIFLRTEDGTPIQYMAGTLSEPVSGRRMEPDALYIGGSPSADDVNQTYFGDCYFQAHLANLAGRAPGLLTEGIRDEGDSVTFRLWRSDGTDWIAAPIRVNRELLHFDSDDSLASAGFRVNPTPTGALWWGELDGAALWIYRDQLHEAALWAPLMEKAYAAYAQQYGQYGGLDSSPYDAEASGYDRVGHGGYNDYAAALLLGPNQEDISPDGSSTANDRTSFTGSSGELMGPAALLSSNIETLRRLVSLRAGSEDGKDTLLEVGLTPDEAMVRLGLVGEEVADRLGDEISEDLADELEELEAEWDDWDSAGRPSTGPKQAALVARAQRLIEPDRFPELHADGARRLLAQLNEKANIVSLLGTDSSPSQRFVYAEHAYSVLDATFVSKEGQIMALTPSTLEDELGHISPSASTVSLRNPHGQNTPDEHGENHGADTGDRGNFDLTLLQFLQTFEWTTELELS